MYMLDHLYVDDAQDSRLRSCDVISYDDVKQYSDHAPLTGVIDL
jgi:endonuclease/exonuclease/phosphatase family metal-dependent hydrolase